MSKLRVHGFSISIDGYGAGPNQGLKAPLGENGEELHEWIFPTRTFKTMYGDGKGTTGTNDDFVKRGFENIGAWILGRNMFGPVRGRWPDDAWRGWWGASPPYRVPVLVLTHHARTSIEMDGGTTFHFVQRAREAAGSRDIRLGGGAATIRQYLRSRLVDEMHFAISPVILGSGEHLFHDLDLRALGYRVTEHVPSDGVTHVMVARGG
jgi:dihydrofolate reductase